MMTTDAMCCGSILTEKGSAGQFVSQRLLEL